MKPHFPHRNITDEMFKIAGLLCQTARNKQDIPVSVQLSVSSGVIISVGLGGNRHIPAQLWQSGPGQNKLHLRTVVLVMTVLLTRMTENKKKWQVDNKYGGRGRRRFLPSTFLYTKDSQSVLRLPFLSLPPRGKCGQRGERIVSGPRQSKRPPVEGTAHPSDYPTHQVYLEKPQLLLGFADQIQRSQRDVAVGAGPWTLCFPVGVFKWKAHESSATP